MSFGSVSSCRVGVPVCTHMGEDAAGGCWVETLVYPRSLISLAQLVLCPILTPQVASAQMLVLPRALWTA